VVPSVEPSVDPLVPPPPQATIRGNATTAAQSFNFIFIVFPDYLKD
jgi:hypothetical protein